MSKFTFDFLYQPQVDFCSGKETALHALTRAGKTWQTISMLTAARDHSKPMIPLMFTEPSRAGLHDACSKAKEQGWDDDNIIFLNKDKHVNLFLSQIRGFDLSEKLFFMVNANGHHYDRVYNAIHTRSGSLSEGIQTIPVLQAEDEAHRGVEKRMAPWVEQDEFDDWWADLRIVNVQGWSEVYAKEYDVLEKYLGGWKLENIIADAQGNYEPNEKNADKYKEVA